MTPDELRNSKIPPISPQPEFAPPEIHKSNARFAGALIVFIFLLLIGITVLVLWLLETEERGAPDIQKEAEQLINEVKKEM